MMVVHNGGYSESHPVYAMAVLMNTAPGQGTLDEPGTSLFETMATKVCAVRKSTTGTGYRVLYDIEFPWPKDQKGSSASNVGTGATEVWFWSPSGAALPAAPQLETDQGPPAMPTRSYLEVSLPGGTGLSGEITLHYTVPPGFGPTILIKRIGETTNIEPPPTPPRAIVKLHTDDYIDPVQIISDPVARQRVMALPNSYPMAPRRTLVSVKVNPATRVHKPAAGPASRGLPTRDRASLDPVKAKWNSDLRTAFRTPIIKLVPPPLQPH